MNSQFFSKSWTLFYFRDIFSKSWSFFVYANNLHNHEYTLNPPTFYDFPTIFQNLDHFWKSRTCYEMVSQAFLLIDKFSEIWNLFEIPRYFTNLKKKKKEMKKHKGALPHTRAGLKTRARWAGALHFPHIQRIGCWIGGLFWRESELKVSYKSVLLFNLPDWWAEMLV